MMVKLLGALLAAGILTLSAVELSCLAAEHPRSPAYPEAGVYSGSIPPDLPTGSETDTDPSASPALTR